MYPNWNVVCYAPPVGRMILTCMPNCKHVKAEIDMFGFPYQSGSNNVICC
uniref:Uncharacterized protein n=1 Tax=Arundo donax TaxID=35708 RepID=A0A0A9C934_ARUDO